MSLVFLRPLGSDLLFEDLKTRDNLVTTFLAVLELAKHRRVVLHQAVRFAPLILTPGKISEED